MCLPIKLQKKQSKASEQGLNSQTEASNEAWKHVISALLQIKGSKPCVAHPYVTVIILIFAIPPPLQASVCRTLFLCFEIKFSFISASACFDNEREQLQFGGTNELYSRVSVCVRACVSVCNSSVQDSEDKDC